VTYQAVRRTPRPGQPSSTRHLGLRRAGGYAGLADAVPMLPPQRLAILGYDGADIGPRERYLPGPPLSHADGKHVAADPLGAAAAARAHVEASAGAIVVHFDVDAVDSAGLPLANYPHHGEGLTLGTAVTVPPELRASPAVICLVLTEVNPTHDPGGELLGRYIDGVTAALAESPRPKEVAGLTRALPSASPDHPGGRQSHFWC
jgi:arginase